MLASRRVRVFFPLAGAEERHGGELPQPLVHAIRLQGGIQAASCKSGLACRFYKDVQV